jgi:phosphate starvation-inducible membrane PsiE
MMPERATALFVIYFILILVSQFILNIYLAKQLCNSPSNVGTAAVATIIPWILIFGLLNLLLTMFPGWLAAFSNTIGYAVASVIGVSSLFTEKLLNVGTPPNKDALKVIQNILSDPSTIINTLNDENIVNFWNKSVEVQLFKNGLQPVQNANASNSPLFSELKKYIMLKNLVSYFIWYLLTGILITSISYNYMLTVPCVQTPKQARAAAAQFLADKKDAQTSADAAKSSAPVYKTDGK